MIRSTNRDRKLHRGFFRHDNRLHDGISHLIHGLLRDFVAEAVCRPLQTGILMFQSSGAFCCCSPRRLGRSITDAARLSQLLRQRTIGLFLKLCLTTEPFAETLLRWRHSGFSVDNSVLLDGGFHRARQELAQYAARAPMSPQEFTYDAVCGRVLYHTAYNSYPEQNTTHGTR